MRTSRLSSLFNVSHVGVGAGVLHLLSLTYRGGVLLWDPPRRAVTETPRCAECFKRDRQPAPYASRFAVVDRPPGGSPIQLGCNQRGPAWRAVPFIGLFSIFVLVELAWDNAGKRTGSSNHEKPHNSSAGQVRSGPVSVPGAAVMSRLQLTTGVGHRRGRARQARPMRSRRPPCRRQQRSRRASLHHG